MKRAIDGVKRGRWREIEGGKEMRIKDERVLIAMICGGGRVVSDGV